MGTQLINPNLNASGIVGYCEAFARDVWNSKTKYPSAIAGWNATPNQFKHLNQEPPADVAVQMYWEYQEDGHTATSIPGKGILSSPWKPGTPRAWLTSRAQLERIYSDNGKYPLIYLGWSEYFNGVQVAQIGTNMPYVDQSVIDDYEKWKTMGEFLSQQPAYPAMGGSPGKPLEDPSGIKVVLDDYEKIKQEHQSNDGIPTVVINGTTYVPKGL